MRKVIVRIAGGIGNQLFSYAAARRLAYVNQAELVLDHINGFAHDKQYQRSFQLDRFSIPCRTANAKECLKPFPRLRRRLWRHQNKDLNFAEKTYLCQEDMNFDSRLLNLNVQHSLYLEGYWQSEDYFKDIEAIIRSDLQIQSPNDIENTQLAEAIKHTTSVAVHCRFYEDPSLHSIHNLPNSYYTNALKIMTASIPDAHYFIFSDRPDLVQQHIDFNSERVTYVHHNSSNEAYKDLWLMSQCKHFIIANSTFSWWGAWLSQHPNKKIIAPKVEIRQGIACWGFDRLLPQEWIQI